MNGNYVIRPLTGPGDKLYIIIIFFLFNVLAWQTSKRLSFKLY